MNRRLSVEKDVPIPMRDGSILMADLYRQDGEGPQPGLLTRTPYGKGGSNPAFALAAAERGYTVIQQDTRGRWSSGGSDEPFIHEKQDGFDTIEWIARQPWSNGRVGMFGGSYMGYTQWAAAASQPPALQAIVPAISFCDPYAVSFRGGVLALGSAVSWSLMTGAQMAIQRMQASPEEKLRLRSLWTGLVDGMASGATFRSSGMPEMPLIGTAGIVPGYSQVLDHPVHDPFWERLRCSYECIRVPSLQVGGWYDIFLADTLNDYTRLAAASQTPRKLIVGPWTYGSFESIAGEVGFGIQASGLAVQPDAIQLSWFDAWLKDQPGPILEKPPVRIFVMGDNRWRYEREWPLARTRYTPFYLHSAGQANTLHGDGVLSEEIPGAQEPPDLFVYDPTDPVPTVGGGLCCYTPVLRPGAFDQRAVEERRDVLVYTTQPLEADLEVTGPLAARLWISTSAVDTDFSVKLVDVHPTGLARNIQDGIVRTRFRGGDMRPELLEPGAVTELEVDLAATSSVFKAGHSIRVEISSSNFPRFDRNPNTGANFGEPARLIPAQQTVLHDSSHPSHIVLPLIPR